MEELEEGGRRTKGIGYSDIDKIEIVTVWTAELGGAGKIFGKGVEEGRLGTGLGSPWEEKHGFKPKFNGSSSK